MCLCAYLQLLQYYHHGLDSRFYSKLATQLQLMYVHIKVYKYVANSFYHETIIIYVYISAYIPMASLLQIIMYVYTYVDLRTYSAYRRLKK